MSKVRAEISVNAMTFEPMVSISYEGKTYTVALEFLEYMDQTNIETQRILDRKKVDMLHNKLKRLQNVLLEIKESL